MGRASRRKRGDADVQRRKRNPPQLQGRAHTLPTRWNGEPCEARRCKIEVGQALYSEEHWSDAIVGEVRLAVEMKQDGKTFYIDDEPFEPTDRMRAWAREYGMDPDAIPKGYYGHGWDKITKGRGAPRYAHRDLYPRRVVEYLDDLGHPIDEAAA